MCNNIEGIIYGVDLSGGRVTAHFIVLLWACADGSDNQGGDD